MRLEQGLTAVIAATIRSISLSILCAVIGNLGIKAARGFTRDNIARENRPFSDEVHREGRSTAWARR
jgi:hypothetical protein